MFKKRRNKIQSYKQSKLKTILAESTRDTIIKSSLYTTCTSENNTEKIGKIAFKTVKDIARGDAICTVLCAISNTCESIGLCCSMIKTISFKGRFYIGAKVVSKDCMTYINLCVGEEDLRLGNLFPFSLIFIEII